MSNFRKTAIAGAVLAGLALSGAASAYTVTSNGTSPATFTTEGIAYFDVNGTTTQAVGIYKQTTVT